MMILNTSMMIRSLLDYHCTITTHGCCLYSYTSFSSLFCISCQKQVCRQSLGEMNTSSLHAFLPEASPCPHISPSDLQQLSCTFSLDSISSSSSCPTCTS